MNGRSFNVTDQEWFARISGDTNPVHMDAAYASRTFPGAPMVHGVHALLWALDQVCKADPSIRIEGIQASFIKPILLGDHVTVIPDKKGLRVIVRGETMTVARFLDPRPENPTPISEGPTWQSGPRPIDHSGKNLTGAAGEIEATASQSELSVAFPHLARATDSNFLVGLAAISTLVGMTCPGLHSVLSEITATRLATARGTLAFRVERHDHRLSRVEISVAGPGLHGTVAAFANDGESPAIDSATIRALVTPAAFEGHSPLIIGATSGLGSATARLLAAGGARPVLGYRDPILSGVTRDSVQHFGECELVRFDATAPTEGLKNLVTMGWRGGEAYYFASPRIFRRRIEPYQSGDLRDFLSVFVDGFYETVRGLVELRAGKPLTIFYPSSVALDEPAPELFEYKTAKLVGEDLCKRLMERYRNLKIISTRLPRIKTRQTQTVLKVRAETPETVMASIVKQVQEAAAQSGSPT
jgi:NAD(P)-dependent dehydrogenase (short-subunit alcohol dehydrogenase family)